MRILPVQAYGFTLLEILIVITILGTVAAAAVPMISSPDPQRLDLAAEEVASALRFARNEAMRTGQDLGVNSSTAQGRVRVFRYDLSQPSPVEDYSVYHPIDKKLYDITFASAPFTAGVTITKADFKSGSIPYGSVLFNKYGSPFLVSGNTVETYTSGSIELSQGDRKKTVAIEPETGRVSIN
jgi:prepilin-type N-terminal cleavage/methylation domain-containing protein